MPEQSGRTSRKVHAKAFVPARNLVRFCPVNLVIKEGTTPVFCEARQVPVALRGVVSLELDTLVKTGVLVAVFQSEWVVPRVVVPKPNNKVRLCGNFEVALNRCLRTRHYPLPIIEYLLVMMSGSNCFAVLDLSSAYQQLELHLDVQSLAMVNTHKALFRYARLRYGLTCAPFIFQAVINNVLKRLDRVACYLDDVLIAASSF